MIEVFRKYINTTIAKVLLGLLVIAFIFLWGGAGGIQTIGINKSQNVATVGGRGITANDYMRQLSRVLASIEQRSGEKLTLKQIQELGIDQQVLESMVVENLMALEAKSLGLHVSDAFVAGEVKKQQIFFDQSGTFSKAVFDARIKQLGFRNEREFVKQRKQEINQARLINALSESLTVPETLVTPTFQWDRQMRSGRAIPLDYRKVPVDAPTEDALREYFGEHRAQFRFGEARNIELLFIDEAHFTVSAKAIKKEDVEALYALEKSTKYKDVTPAVARARITNKLISDMQRDKLTELAQKIDAALENGDDLSKIARTYGKFVTVDGLREQEGGYVAHKSSREIDQKTMKLIGQLAFNAGVEDLAGPEIAPNQKAVVLRVTSVKAPRFSTFSEAREQVRDSLVRVLKLEKSKAYVANINERHSQGEPLSRIAASYKLGVIPIKATRREIMAPAKMTTSVNGLQQFFSTAVDGMVLIPVRDKHDKNIVLVAVLDQITLPPVTALTDPDSYRKILRDSYAGDMLEHYIDFMKQKYKIDINKASLDRLFEKAAPR